MCFRRPIPNAKKIALSLVLVVWSFADPLSLLAGEEDGSDAGWGTLFDGKSLDGWKANESAETWSVKDGAIVANGPVSHLFYVGSDGTAQFGDFELKLEVRTSPNTNSGVFFRQPWQDSGWLRKGFEAQIQNSGKNSCYTGGLWQHAMRAETSPVPDNEWFELHITAIGSRVTVRVNGQVVTEYDDANEPRGFLKGFRNGHIALQGHGPSHRPEFRNIRIRTIDSES